MPTNREWEMVLNYNIAGEYCFTMQRWWEIQESAKAVPGEHLAELWVNQLLPLLQVPSSGQVTFDTLYVRCVAEDAQNPIYYPINLPGVDIDDSLPPNSTIVLTWYGEKRLANGRIRRRSNGWSGCAERYQASGLLTTAGYNAYRNFANATFAGLDSPDTNGGYWYPVMPGLGDVNDRAVRFIQVRPNTSTRKTRRRRQGIAP